MKPTADKINDLLPQTQCGLCDYDGCKPYAQAIVNDNEKIDSCLPGGIPVLNKIAELTGQDPTPMQKIMAENYKQPSIVNIREHECIGCTKCIQACPVDAIIGSAKQMHTVITSECTGCDLCIEPCPVDCIDIIKTTEIQETIQNAKSIHAKTRYENRNKRIEKIKQEKQNKHQTAKLANTDRNQTLDARKAAIQAALQRVKNRQR